uniref:Nuclear receptor-binding protein n=1 Tax=Eptatretus burgeri TaxID=7764 RepID=A0A8C4QS53_EPTBU
MSETESVEKERDTSLTAFSTAITNSVISTSAAEKEKREKGVDEVEEESEDESDILEESPCGRWQKRREEVNQRNVPGIDNAYLAMDTEEGVEVVWNEVQFSERRNFKAQEEKIKAVFNNLIQLEHPNIVNFHKYWADGKENKARVIFITEYMSSGSLKQFLKKTKKNHKTMNEKAWKRWCTQIISALSYLHSFEPPIIHGNLTCDTIFMQHNGLIKIGSVAPDAIHNHVKTYREEQKNLHFFAPEYATLTDVTTAVDIYSFGMCALEMAVLEIQGNGDTACVSQDAITGAINNLEDLLTREFIQKCLRPIASQRPTARELLFHRALFEVPSLKLLAAHCFVTHARVYGGGREGEACLIFCLLLLSFCIYFYYWLLLFLVSYIIWESLSDGWCGGNTPIFELSKLFNFKPDFSPSGLVLRLWDLASQCTFPQLDVKPAV